MKIRHRFRRKPARIDLVPLIDVVFLLLVFFIYSLLSMAVHKGMNVDLPESASPPPSSEAAFSVSLTARDGQILVYLGKELVGLPELEARLRAGRQEQNGRPEVLLFADRAVPYQELYRVLDRISAAGIAAISLQAAEKR
ncbi:MAG TPA: biopolymer transporter ExbD [Desulfobulbaceae bacterium]|nr:biopolymer transporter ExbD [Desulfobulbaceae bacterium]